MNSLNNFENESIQKEIQDKFNGSKDDSVIWRPYDEKYRTDKWYTGTGQIIQEPNKKSFEVTANYQLKSKIQVADDILDVNNTLIADQYKEYGRCVSVVEQTVNDLYGERLEKYFEHYQIKYQKLVMRAMEADKTIRSVELILKFLGKDGCDVARNEPILIVGGGVLSDVGGLACSLQHRRTPYIMIGTTVVAAVDAGPSPRTCCNGDEFKNSIGAYHPPILTIVDRAFFKTLPKGHIRNGMAEIVKMAITDDFILFQLCEKYGLELIETHFATTSDDENLKDIANEVIYRALYSYMKHEGTNMFETYQDRPHAYGHTWSPRFEPTAKLIHGHAVSICMAFGATLSYLLGWCTEEERDRIIGLLVKLELSVHHPIIEDSKIMISGQENMRKKRGMGGLWAPLPRGIGSCDYAKEVDEKLLIETIQTHKAICSKLNNNGAGKEMYLKDLGLF
jgi:3-dehydroquinate synthase